MSLLDELKKEYSQAYDEYKNKTNELVEIKYEEICDFLHQAARDRKTFASIDYEIFNDNKLLKNRVVKKFIDEGFQVVTYDFIGYFEISGWDKEVNMKILVITFIIINFMGILADILVQTWFLMIFHILFGILAILFVQKLKKLKLWR